MSPRNLRFAIINAGRRDFDIDSDSFKGVQ
jgi:hypothetical protein